jgi:transcriptional regulator with XRE-family HTH domain
MDPLHPVWSTPEIRQARERRDVGALVRLLRRAQGLTLTGLGDRCGYSASQISRYERGITPLTDVTVLHRFADALGVTPQTFGLLPGDPPNRPESAPPRACAPRVIGEADREDGDDPVRRRELLAGAAGLTGAAALGLPARAAARNCRPAGGLAAVLYGTPPGAAPVTLPALRAAVTKARACFQAARYDHLHHGLADLIATAAATRDHVDAPDASVAGVLLANAYITASHFMIKLNDDQLAWATADRAVQAAEAAGDPLVLADARRAVATVLRRTGRPTVASDLLLATAKDIEPGGDPTGEQLSMYGTLLQVAAYTAAVDGNRQAAREYITEAKAAADRLGHDANHHFTAFGPTNVTLYQVSIAQVLGDNGTAIEHAKALNPAAIPTTERRGRYWIDVARSYHQWGKREACYKALRAAERAAPAEVRYRPPVHRMTEDLLRADNRNALPGLRAFADRIGVLA